MDDNSKEPQAESQSNGHQTLVQPPSVPASSRDTAIALAGASDSGSSLDLRFGALMRDWKEAMRFSSSITDNAMHPAYQQIIGMGKEVLPLILNELRREPDQWFWALKAITGEDPVPTADRGKLRQMTAAWLSWARERGY